MHSYHQRGLTAWLEFTAPSVEMSDCVVCHEALAASGEGCRTLACNHVLHETCIRELRRFAPTWLCPICRDASTDILTVSHLYYGAIVSLQQKAYVEVRKGLYVPAVGFFRNKLFFFFGLFFSCTCTDPVIIRVPILKRSPCSTRFAVHSARV